MAEPWSKAVQYEERGKMKNQPLRNIFCLAVCVGFLIVCSGCASAPEPAPATEVIQPPPSPPPPKVTYYTHAVKWPGESLSIIAGWYTGDVQNWKDLAEANPDINPNRIHEGMKILIPENMITTKAVMTKDYVDSYYPKPKKAAPKPSASHPKEEEPVLFGPKQYPAK